MNKTVFLVIWNQLEAEQWTKKLEAAGWEVSSESEDLGRAYDAIVRIVPAAVVVGLDRDPAFGTKVARSIHQTAEMTIPVVFVGGTPEERELATLETNEAIFTSQAELVSVLDKLRRG